MDDSTLVPWRRYGKDRTYVKDATGRQLGFRDNLTGDLVPGPGVPAGDLARALAAAGVPLPRSQAEAILGPEGSALADVDLAENRPGCASEAKADEVRRAEVARWRDAAEREYQLAVAGHEAAARRHADVVRDWERRTESLRATAVGRLLLRVTGRAGPPEAPRPPQPPCDEPPPTKDDVSWRVGAEGERAVGSMLETLGDGWHVLHGVPVGTRGSDLDHVVLGPGGVFAVNTKSHSGQRIWVAGHGMYVGGRPVHHIGNSRLEAERAGAAASRALNREVRASGVVAVLGARAWTIAAPAVDPVVVLPAEELVDWLRQAPRLLSPEDVTTLFCRLRYRSAWGN